MADMMASEVGLLLSPKYTQDAGMPTIGTKGFCWLAILFYFHRTSIGLIIFHPPPHPCCAICHANVAAEHVIIL
jgi:hypothetical protein